MYNLHVKLVLGFAFNHKFMCFAKLFSGLVVGVFMAKFVKVATFMFNPVLLKDKPQDMDVVDYEIAWIEENINKVLIDKPDLIVLYFHNKQSK